MVSTHWSAAYRMHYFPVARPILLVFSVLFLAAVVLVELRIVKHAHERLGIPPRYVFGVLLLSLAGSYVNIPVARLPAETIVTPVLVDYFGVPYVVPAVHEWPGTVIAINVGGAVVPTALSVYLTVKNRFGARAFLAVTIVALLVHSLARLVPGVGITVPTFAPPLAAAVVAMVLAWRRAPALAYVAGSMGTLIGADLTNLGRLDGLGAAVASIGGAGTFDGVFLTGVIAMLLPPIRPRPPDSALRDPGAG